MIIESLQPQNEIPKGWYISPPSGLWTLPCRISIIITPLRGY